MVDIVQKVKEEEREIVEDGKVIIKMGAFRNMITHVLRFGSEALDYSVEVMGICMGKKDKDDNFIVENAIPIAHGSREQVGFTNEDMVAFAQIDEQYADKGMYAIGWYHSHPSWGCFFSDMDIKNHLFWQKKQTPNAFGIVFDHSLMGKEGNLGFEIYRLSDYTKGPQSDYVQVQYEIEIPKSLGFYKWVQKFVEDSQKKAPVLIKEINEIIEPVQGDLQAIPTPEGGIDEEGGIDPYPKITPIVSGFQEGTAKFAELFMGPMKSQLGSWTNDVTQGALKGTEFMRTTLSQMSEAITFGMAKVQSWFEKNLEEIVDSFKVDVSEYMDTRIKAQKELASEISESAPQTVENLVTLIMDKTKEMVNNIANSAKENFDKLNTANQANAKLEGIINKNSETITSVTNGATTLSDQIGKNIDASIAPFEENISKDIENLTTELNTVKETYSKMKEMFDKLQKSIMELRNI